MSHAEFWRLTPLEVNERLLAHRDITEAAQRVSVHNAWLTASLSKARKIPQLSRLLPVRARRLTQTDKDWAARIRAAEGAPEIPDRLRS